MVLTFLRRWRWTGLAAAILLAIINSGCRSPNAPVLHTAHYAVTVPFEAQRGENDCGAAALAMLIRHHGEEPDIDQLNNELTIPALGGTVPALLVKTADSKGYGAVINEGDPEAVRKALRDGMPPIVLLGPTATSVGHFIVVTGMTADGNHIRAHDGIHRDRWQEPASFSERWRQTNYLTIRIHKEQSTAN